MCFLGGVGGADEAEDGLSWGCMGLWVRMSGFMSLWGYEMEKVGYPFALLLDDGIV